MYKIVIAKQLKQYRIQQHLSQSEVAALMHVTPQSISKWETESAYPDILLLPRLAQCLGCSVDDFFEKKD